MSTGGNASFYMRHVNQATYKKGEKIAYLDNIYNPGNHYNSDSGEYTCPVSGVYLFVFAVQGERLTDGRNISVVSAVLKRNDDRITGVFMANDNPLSIKATLSQSVITYCNHGDRVYIESDWDNNKIEYTLDDIFGGVLMYHLK